MNQNENAVGFSKELWKREEIVQRMLPAGSTLTPKRVIQLAISAICATPALMSCNQMLLIKSVGECAQMGLIPNSPLGHVHIVPFGDKPQIIIGFKGYLELARRSGDILKISSSVVFENDSFEYEKGINERIIHKPTFENCGKIIGAYAIAKLANYEHQIEFMTLAQIESIKINALKRSGASPWRDEANFGEMARKTVIRRLAKSLPLTPELAKAVNFDGKADAGESQSFDFGAEVIDVEGGDFATQSQATANIPPPMPKTGNAGALDKIKKSTEKVPTQVVAEDEPF